MKNFNLNKLIRKNILNLKPYSSARDEFQAEQAIFLDANENPFGNLNRYPDPYQLKLKTRLAEIKNTSVKNIFLGNGSDEVIDLAIRIFCEPAKDKIIVCSPTYGMYGVLSAINNVEAIDVPLNHEFQLDIENILEKAKSEDVKIIFVCSPNNPTGNILSNIELILNNFSGIIFVDEAYIDFANTESFQKKIEKYPNLIVSQTFSKSWGMAAARIGVGYANEEVIEIFNKVKPPYNISSLNQNAVFEKLENQEKYQQNVELIIKERENLISELKKIKFIQKVYSSDSNFILIQIENASEVYKQLIQNKIIVRDRTTQISDSLRITVGTPVQNQKLLKELNSIFKNKNLQ